jgi:hypothetical protein
MPFYQKRQQDHAIISLSGVVSHVHVVYRTSAQDTDRLLALFPESTTQNYSGSGAQQLYYSECITGTHVRRLRFALSRKDLVFDESEDPGNALRLRDSRH